MISYLSKISARLSEIAEPIRELAKHKVPFNWGPEHQSVFTQMKKRLPVLPYWLTKIQRSKLCYQTDASIKGLGACLLQEEKPVDFASKALTDAQSGNVAIELEWLAVAWAMQKFHHFFYASHFILENGSEALRSNFIQEHLTKLLPDYKEFWLGHSNTTLLCNTYQDWSTS